MANLLSTTINGTGTATSDFRAPIFYDSANTGYYLDLNGTSYLYHLILSGNSYFRPSSWIQLDGNYGLYWPGYYGLHIYPNNDGSYGSLQVKGSKNSWHGIHFDSGNTLMSNANEAGFHQQGVGWKFRWYAGEMYISANSTGGGTERTVIHSGNIGSQSVNYATSAGSAPANGGTSTYATYLNPLSGDGNYKLAYTADGARTNAGEWGRAVMYYVPNGQTYGIRVDRADDANSVGGYTFNQQLKTSSSPSFWGLTVEDKLGIGTNAPQDKLHIKTGYGGGLIVEATDEPTIYLNTTNGQASTTIFNAYGNFGIEGTTATSNYIMYHYGGGGTAANQYTYFQTAGATRMRINGNGNVGIGTTAPAYRLDVSGDIRATGDIIAYSDARVKENVQTIENPVEMVLNMRGVFYNKIEETDRKVGVIAQEMLEVLPEVVSEDETGMYSVAYGNITAVLIEAIKAQQLQIEELKAEIKNLKSN